MAFKLRIPEWAAQGTVPPSAVLHAPLCRAVSLTTARDMGPTSRRACSLAACRFAVLRGIQVPALAMEAMLPEGIPVRLVLNEDFAAFDEARRARLREQVTRAWFLPEGAFEIEVVREGSVVVFGRLQGLNPNSFGTKQLLALLDGPGATERLREEGLDVRAAHVPGRRTFQRLVQWAFADTAAPGMSSQRRSSAAGAVARCRVLCCAPQARGLDPDDTARELLLRLERAVSKFPAGGSVPGAGATTAMDGSGPSGASAKAACKLGARAEKEDDEEEEEDSAGRQRLHALGIAHARAFPGTAAEPSLLGYEIPVLAAFGARLASGGPRSGLGRGALGGSSLAGPCVHLGPVGGLLAKDVSFDQARLQFERPDMLVCERGGGARSEEERLVVRYRAVAVEAYAEAVDEEEEQKRLVAAEADSCEETVTLELEGLRPCTAYLVTVAARAPPPGEELFPDRPLVGRRAAAAAVAEATGAGRGSAASASPPVLLLTMGEEIAVTGVSLQTRSRLLATWHGRRYGMRWSVELSRETAFDQSLGGENRRRSGDTSQVLHTQEPRAQFANIAKGEVYRLEVEDVPENTHRGARLSLSSSSSRRRRCRAWVASPGGGWDPEYVSMRLLERYPNIRLKRLEGFCVFAELPEEERGSEDCQ